MFPKLTRPRSNSDIILNRLYKDKLDVSVSPESDEHFLEQIFSEFRTHSFRKLLDLYANNQYFVTFELLVQNSSNLEQIFVEFLRMVTQTANFEKYLILLPVFIRFSKRLHPLLNCSFSHLADCLYSNTDELSLQDVNGLVDSLPFSCIDNLRLFMRLFSLKVEFNDSPDGNLRFCQLSYKIRNGQLTVRDYSSGTSRDKFYQRRALVLLARFIKLHGIVIDYVELHSIHPISSIQKIGFKTLLTTMVRCRDSIVKFILLDSTVLEKVWTV
ncbi:hypothetical protein P9112_003338 [Eukaryota sp. TZLM1-RC]